ncbi:ATP synthase F1 subunit delta [Holophaga foetida]|uniref:ATP synthase F1 subunit delta n=1 Tax=Holophaga foetida TaxID=35839 RepID=UPI00024750E3|nr:ATP synthase F1 subunit delta [Holophaga foetida]
MSGRLVAQRYAKALVEIGVKEGSLESLQGELTAVDALVRSNADLQRLTTYPLLAPSLRAEALDAVLAQAGASSTLRKFFKVVTLSARLSLVHLIIEAFNGLVDKQMGIVEAKVSFAQALSEAQASALSATLGRRTGKTVRMRWSQDPALLGGLKVQLGSTIYDASLQGQLRLLKAQLLSA